MREKQPKATTRPRLSQPSDSGSGAKEAGACERPGKGRPSTKGVGPIPSLRQTTPPSTRPSHPPPPTTATSAPPGPSQYLERASPRRPSPLCPRSPATLPRPPGSFTPPPPTPLPTPQTSTPALRVPLPSPRPWRRRERYYLCHARCPWPWGAAALDPGRFSVL